MTDTDNKTKIYKGRALYVIGILLCLFCGVFLGHPDAHTLSGWAKDLLDCIFSGNYSGFPEYTYELRNNATNYSMLANLMMAVLLLPVYALDNLTTLDIDIYGYVFFEKLMILAVTFLDVHIFGRIMEEMGFEKHERLYAKGLFMCSAIVCVATVAKGQTDAIVMFFVLAAVRFFQKKRYAAMALMFGISFVIKPFTILMAVPVLLLLLEKLSVMGIIIRGIIFFIPFLLDQAATRIFWRGYYVTKLHTDEASRILFGETREEALFSIKVGSMELFLAVVLIVCFICMYRGMNKKVRPRDYAIYPVILYAALAAFVSATFYWFIAVLPLWIILGLKSKSRWCLPVLLLGNSIGAMVPLLFNERLYHVSLVYNLPGKLMGAEIHDWAYNWDFRMTLVDSGNTLFVISQILILTVFLMERNVGDRSLG